MKTAILFAVLACAILLNAEEESCMLPGRKKGEKWRWYCSEGQVCGTAAGLCCDPPPHPANARCWKKIPHRRECFTYEYKC